ncbi:MAG: AMP-binding protein, partial [Mycobacteriaceae bacterium]
MPGTQERQAARRCHWVNHLARHAHEQPEAVAFRFRGRSITWRELDERVDRLASAFARRGVGHGDRVVLLMTNRMEFVEAMLAANRLGAIAVPVNFRLSPDELAYIVTDSDPALIVVEQLLAPAVPAVLAATPDARCLVVGDDPAAAGPRAECWQNVLDESGEQHPVVDVGENDPALIMYTSGTTGRPKGAVLTHLNLHVQAVTIICAWGSASSAEISLGAAPLFHIAGVGTIAPMMLLGSTMVIHPTGLFSASDILDVMEREQISVVFLVPTQWQAVCADPTVTARDLALRVISWGAA